MRTASPTQTVNFLTGQAEAETIQVERLKYGAPDYKPDSVLSLWRGTVIYLDD